jgi:hypothetical protein
MKQPDLVHTMVPTRGSASLRRNRSVDASGHERRTTLGATSVERHGTCRPGRDFALPHVDRNAESRPFAWGLEAKP